MPSRAMAKPWRQIFMQGWLEGPLLPPVPLSALGRLPASTLWYSIIASDCRLGARVSTGTGRHGGSPAAAAK
eukprot:15675493-Heterocapsa_arctica.AAC.1